MPPYILDYKSMVAHAFIVDNKEKMLLYNLRFNKKHNEIIVLPAPSLFDLTACPYTTREKPSSSAGFGPISSAGRSATDKALQLMLSNSAS